ncbi:unnamed protein product [Moneuplotes crassus]|uniref:Uncharacterized protein n=1 Tax=Euplotes crassus TaxID=5936 RepID=A0AAD1Y0T6_EUPCR|nr:unnamed protein product [Moneuplotes crassus]
MKEEKVTRKLTLLEKEIPPCFRTIISIMEHCGIEEYDEQVIPMILSYIKSKLTKIIEDANQINMHCVAEGGEAPALTEESLRLAFEISEKHESNPKVPSISEVNSKPLPRLPKKGSDFEARAKEKMTKDPGFLLNPNFS